MEAEKDVPRAPMHQRQRCIDLQRALNDAELHCPGLGPQHADDRGHDVVADHQQPRKTPGFAIGDGALFRVGLRARHLVVIEVKMAADPGIDGARPGEPDQSHHQVVRHFLLAEVHAVDQVVFQLMGQRGEKSIEQQARPPGHVPAHVERRRTDHTGDGEGQNACAESVLMLENRVFLTQFDTSGQHHFTDMG
ncbi:hypothetical protein D9M73_174810 [compost metagenome]